MSDNIAVTRTGYAHGAGGILSKPALARGVLNALAKRRGLKLPTNKDITAAQRKAVPSADFAGPHKSFPITSQTQVNSAARLAGHAANPGAVRSAIKRIAKRKGLKLPKAWNEKAANYGAHVGQAIAGRLVRGAGGKFSSSGASEAPADPNKTDAQRIAESKVRAEQAATAAGPKAKGGGKGKGGAKGGKGKAPVKTPEQKKAEAAKLASDNLNKVAGQLKNSDLAEIFTVGDNPLDMSGLNDTGKKALLDAGLGTKHADGSVELNANGKALVKAMQKGDAALANRILAHAKGTLSDVAARQTAQGQKKSAAAALRAQRQATAAAKHQAAQEAAAKRRAEAAKRLRDHAAQIEARKSFHVFKDTNGQYRWVTFSSSSFEDKDGETIAQKALEDDVLRAEQTGEYGPLCWWHMNGFGSEPLVRLGECDFNAMSGRILVESGTFVNEGVAKAVEGASELLGISIGFIPTPATRGEGVVFTKAVIKERSLLPDFAASNFLTKVFVGQPPDQEKDMSKLAALKALVGDALFGTLVQEATMTEKSAQEQGLTYKATMDPKKAPPVPPVLDEKADGVMTDPTMLDDGDPEDLADGGADEATEDDLETSMGDEEIDALVQALHDDLDKRVVAAVTEALRPISEGLQTALTQATDTATKETSAVMVVKGQVEALTKTVATLQEKLKEMEGEAPAIIKQNLLSGRGGRATTNGGQIVPKEASDKLDAITKEKEVDPYAVAAFGSMPKLF